ncbi:type II toxin-antitoxin system VapC family toxin [Deinococcus sp.]|uniref:type II toxin-antitoxin system VapC family toxin n=1 Tax=Deinococcus sp. TaxID=47478 RepID=UPI0025B8B794|nr:type II toxin-antitoxin system VapC family toxin [Deinococcus sp.]
MNLLLDTHILLWATLQPALLPGAWQTTLLDSRNRLILSAATAWELSIKHRSGRLPEAAPLLLDFHAVAARLGAKVIDISPAHAVRAGALDWDHRDPFDRMLVAQATEHGLTLMTVDASITAYAHAPVLPPP